LKLNSTTIWSSGTLPHHKWSCEMASRPSLGITCLRLRY